MVKNKSHFNTQKRQQDKLPAAASGTQHYFWRSEISSPKAALTLRLRHRALPPELGINKCCLLVATSHNNNLKTTA